MNWDLEWQRKAHEIATNGGSEKVALEVLAIKKHSISERELRSFSHLCRRVGLPFEGVLTLFKKVRKSVKPASEAELAEYACCLARIGRQQEALQIFNGFSEQAQTVYGLEYADVLCNIWDYQNANKVLKKCLENTPEGYKKDVVGLNYLASLIVLEQLDEAKEIAFSLTAKLSQANKNKLLGNCFELLGQIYLLNDDWEMSRNYLNQSLELLSRDSSLGSILPRKWLAIGEMKFSNKSEYEKLVAIENIKKEARGHRHWETVRHIDFQIACFLKDNELFSKLYHASPLGFRENILNKHRSDFELKNTIPWDGGDQPVTIELGKDIQSKASKTLQTHQVLYKLFFGLLSDPYIPSDIFSLHSKAFPDEYFNPHSSVDKTHKAIGRLKEFLASTDLKIEISNNQKYGYRLRSLSGLIIKYPETDLVIGSIDQKFVSDLKNHFGVNEFSREQVDNVLGFKPRKSRRLLSSATEQGLLRVSGKGRGTKYKVA